MDKKRVETMTTALKAVLGVINSPYVDDGLRRPNGGEIARWALGLSALSPLTPESCELERILDRILEYSRGVRLFMPPDYTINQ
jgi:hypothetical protein